MLKLFKILIAVVMLLSFMPMEAFCDDDHGAEEKHHCALVCHVSCHPVTAPVFLSVSLDAPEVLTFAVSQSLSYENPVISGLKRPPAVSA